eukprot:07952.XXX_106371_103956_1 [CDS] Oithona nana genome sequencing.
MATKSWSTLALGLVVFVVLLAYVRAQPYDDHLAYGDEDLDMDYLDNYRDLLQHQASQPQKRSWGWVNRPLNNQDAIIRNGKRFFLRNEYVKRRLCILPQMSCNTMPNSCCGDTTCRCNLWGQNCRCLRMGFFQRWGK